MFFVIVSSFQLLICLSPLIALLLGYSQILLQLLFDWDIFCILIHGLICFSSSLFNFNVTIYKMKEKKLVVFMF